MSHSQGFFQPACKGTFKKYHRARDGVQTYRCPRCGRLKQRKVKPCFLGMHTWRKDRTYKKRTVLKCRNCGTKKGA